MTNEHYSDALAIVISIILFGGVLMLGSNLSARPQLRQSQAQTRLQADYQKLRVDMDQTKQRLSSLEGRTASFVAGAEELANR